MSHDLVTGAKGAADYLGISANSVYHLTSQGELPVIRKGRRLYYRKSDLEAAFQSSTENAA